MVAWSGGELAIARGAELAAQRLLADRDRKLVPDPLRQVDQPPPHDAMRRRDRSGLDDAQERMALLRAEQCLGARRLAVDQTIRAALGDLRPLR